MLYSATLFWKRYKILIIFFCIEFVFNIIQALKTEITNNECYFQVIYSENLKWGYMEYPPAIALLIKAGTLLIGKNILGVRIFSVIFNLILKIILWNLCDAEANKKNVINFITIYFSIILFSFVGFTITPDIILVFFFALALLLYKKFLKHQTYLYSISLGIVWAIMAYSKYEAILIIFLFILSNKSFFFKKKFILAIVIATIVFIPHLIWIYQNRYAFLQLSWLSNTPPIINYRYLLYFGFKFVCFLGPLGVFFLLIKVRKKIKSGDAIYRLSVFLIIGLCVFYGIKSSIYSIKSYSALYVFCPLVFVLLFNTLRLYKILILFRINLILSILVQIILRLSLIYHPFQWQGDFGKSKSELKFLKDVIDGNKIIFLNSLPYASKYNFYEHKGVPNIETFDYAKSEFKNHLSPSRYNFQNVFLVNEKKYSALWDTLYYKNKNLFYRNFSNFLYWGDSRIFNITYNIERIDSYNIQIDFQFRLMVNPGLKKEAIISDNIKIVLVSLNKQKKVKQFALDTLILTSNTSNILKGNARLTLNNNDLLLLNNHKLKHYFSILQNGDLFYLNSSALKFKF